MCKVAAVMKVNEHNRKKVWNFMKKLGEEMTHHNNDGLGYASVDTKDKIFGEKWLDNKTAFGKSNSKSIVPIGSFSYDSFGEVNRNDSKSIILHTRMATCGVSIDNTHPFVDNLENPTKALIHNGVIYNHSSFDKKYSTCDSEAILTSYTDEQVEGDAENIKHVFEALEGWYVVFNYVTINGRVYLDLFLNTDRRLVSAYVEELQTKVFSTSQWDIKAACEFFGYTFKNVTQYSSDNFWRFNVNTGEPIQKIEINIGTKEDPYSYNKEYWDYFVEMLMSGEDSK